jgi:hypothetical protein
MATGDIYGTGQRTIIAAPVTLVTDGPPENKRLTFNNCGLRAPII